MLKYHLCKYQKTIIFRHVPEPVKSQLLSLALRAFKYNKANADKAMRELLFCVQMHSLVRHFPNVFGISIFKIAVKT